MLIGKAVIANGGSPTVALLMSVAVFPAPSLITTVTGKVPVEEYVCVPVTMYNVYGAVGSTASGFTGPLCP